MDGLGISAVLAADTDLEVWFCCTAKLDAHFYQFTNATYINALEWVVWQDAFFFVFTNEFARVISCLLYTSRCV